MSRLALALAAALAGCSAGPYVCVSDNQCVVSGVHGRCVAAGLGGAGYCAFPDGRCPGSNLRWDGDEASPHEIKNQCVPPALVVDGGAAD